MKRIRITLSVSLIVLVLWLLVTVTLGLVLSDARQTSIGTLASQGLGLPWLLAAALVLGVALMSDRMSMGLQLPKPLTSVRLVWLPLLYVAIMCTLNLLLGLPPHDALFFVFINTMLVGLSEELMFRSILFEGFRSKFALWPTILMTSLLFGIVHSLNAFTTGRLDEALLQSLTAFMQGFAYLAIRIRTKSVWPMVLVHGLWDFSLVIVTLRVPEATSPPPLHPTIPVLIALPVFLYGFFLMRRVGKGVD